MSKTSGWDHQAYRTATAVNVDKTVDQIFSDSMDASNKIHAKTKRVSDPNEFTPNPDSLIIAVDVTGSMRKIPHNLVQPNGLGSMFEVLRNTGLDQFQLCVGGIGDILCDNTPIQFGQFEIEAEKLAKALASLYLGEHGGGGNYEESYALAWLFAARHTELHCNKQGRKGFLFTIGDESCSLETKHLAADDVMRHINYPEFKTISKEALLLEVSKNYEVFHIHANDGSYHNHTSIFNDWKSLLGERFLVCEHYEDIPVMIAAQIARCKEVADDVIKSHLPATKQDIMSVISKHTHAIDKIPGTNAIAL